MHDPLELSLDNRPKFMPDSISREHMPLIFRDVPESVKAHARILLEKGWRIYAVNQTRGRCYGGWKKVITIPVWAIKDKRPNYKTWYISHELAHAFDNCQHNHGPEFMEWLKAICPTDCIHYELGYKPRNASAAGIMLEL